MFAALGRVSGIEQTCLGSLPGSCSGFMFQVWVPSLGSGFRFWVWVPGDRGRVGGWGQGRGGGQGWGVELGWGSLTLPQPTQPLTYLSAVSTQLSSVPVSSSLYSVCCNALWDRYPLAPAPSPPVNRQTENITFPLTTVCWR